MKTNEELQKDVQDAIKWEPLLSAAEIGVSVYDGIVTLTGTVDTYFKKTQAEHAAKSVAGVKAVAENIDVHFGDSWKKNDTEIAIEVLNALKSKNDIPNNRITVRVENGWVTLEGDVAWYYEKNAAKAAVQMLDGITGVSNNIAITSYSQDYVEKTNIERAIERNWSLEDKKIDIKVAGNKVTLHGKVGSLYQWDEAGRIASNAPGVSVVHNELTIE